MLYQSAWGGRPKWLLAAMAMALKQRLHVAASETHMRHEQLAALTCIYDGIVCLPCMPFFTCGDSLFGAHYVVGSRNGQRARVLALVPPFRQVGHALIWA